jgi:hypothetical protein
MAYPGVAVSLLLLGTSTVLADEAPPAFSVSAGVFFTDRDSNTRIDADTGNSGSDINLEGDLGFKKNDNVFRLDGYWRFADHHRLDFSIFDLSRDATKVIQRNITIGDTTFDIDTSVKGKVDLGIYKVDYTWMFRTDGRNFLGASAGLYIANVGTRFTGPLGNQRESDDITAPLPVIGLRGAYHFAERWSVRGSAEIFAFKYGAFDGSLYDVFGGIDYSMTDLVSLGLGFNAVQFDLQFDDNALTGDLDWGYAGAMVYLKFDF